MKKKKLTVLLAEWESLLAAVQESLHGISGLDPYRARLRDACEQVRVAKALQKALQTVSQIATCDLHAAVAQCHDAAVQMRVVLKACLGVRNEELVRFGMTPLRRRRRLRAAPPQSPDAQVH